MKRAVVAAGAFALSAVGLYGANVSGLTPQEVSKWWIVSGSLRSFYDDNMFNSPSGFEESCFGLQFHPGVSINLPLTRTLISGSYDWTMDFYEARVANKIDQTHLFDGRLNHKFSERYELDMTDRFAVSDEPIVFTGGAQNVFRRGDASNVRNELAVDLSALMRPAFGWLGGYKSSLQDYQSDSYSQYLDQVSHTFHLDARWFSSESTLLFAGYQISFTEYTFGKLFIGDDDVEGPDGFELYADIKNNRSHYLYVGARREVSRQLDVSSKVGLQYTDYYNARESSLSPYIDINATYTYLPGSTLQVGANVQRYPADVTAVSGDVTLDQLTGSAFVAVSHKITSRITGNLDLRYQRSIFNGGPDDGSSDDFYSMSMSADYKIREHLFANAAYVRSQLVSGRDFSEFLNFSRNLVYLGVRATY